MSHHRNAGMIFPLFMLNSQKDFFSFNKNMDFISSISYAREDSTMKYLLNGEKRIE